MPKSGTARSNESPLRTITRAQGEKLAAAFAGNPQVVVDWAMRYGNPSIRSVVERLCAQGCDRILTVPLYPQYSATTTATANDKLFSVLMTMRRAPAVRTVPPYYDEPVYIDALARSVEACLAGLDFQPEIVLASFPRHSQALFGQRRPLSRALPGDHAAAARASWLGRGEADHDLPVALRRPGMAAALHRQDGGETGAATA